MRRLSWGLVVGWLLRGYAVFGMVHELTIERDERSLYRIESFCFVEGGAVELAISDFAMRSGRKKQRSAYRAGFVLRKASSESTAQQELEEALEQKICLLDYGEDDSKTVFKLELSSQGDAAKHESGSREIQDGEEGLYSLIFARCVPESGAASYKLQAKFQNPGPRYLSACDAALPLLFAAFFLVYLAMAMIWFALVCLAGYDRRKAHYVHWMMGLLVVFKVVSMLAQAMRYHAVDETGQGEGWQLVYYVFASLKGVTLFVVILLIGTGWSIVKSYLNEREKRVVAVVLCLQVVDNVALVVFEETAPGSQRWLTWRDVLHLVDILCCCAVLFPIVWSIRHLRRAAAADGKHHDNIAKLTLFRQFYVLVVSYIYFTRIVVFLLAATLPYNLLWLRYLFSETATFAFYAVTGFKFRPHEDNPYLPVKKDDDAPDDLDRDLDDEFGGFLEPDPGILTSDLDVGARLDAVTS